MIESREVSAEEDDEDEDTSTTVYGRPMTPGGTRLRVRGGRSVQSSVLVRVNVLNCGCSRCSYDEIYQNLIDLAGSEKATSDKERTREGKYINTRLIHWTCSVLH